MSDMYALRIVGPAFQVVLRMGRQPPTDAYLKALDGVGGGPGEPPTDAETIAAAVEQAAVAGTPLRSLDEDGEHGMLVIPGPGMSFGIVPWAEHLEAAARARAAQHAAQQAAQGRPVIAVPGGGFGQLPRNGRGNKRR